MDNGSRLTDVSDHARDLQEVLQAHEAAGWDADQPDPREEPLRCEGHVHDSTGWTPIPTARRAVIL